MTQPAIPVIGAPQAGGGLRLRSFGVGRLVLILPQREQVVNYKDGTAKDEVVCDMAALDGGPITFGGEANNAGGMVKPDTMIVDAPWFATGVSIGGNAIVIPLRKELPDARIGKPGGGVVGRLWQDATQRNAWKLKDPTTEELALAQRFIEALYAGQFNNPTPRPIAGPPAQGAPTVQYGNMGGTMAPVTNTAAPAWPPPPAQATAISNPFAAPAAPVAPAVPQGPPPGTEAWWGQVTEAQRQQYLAQMAPAAAMSAPTGY